MTKHILMAIALLGSTFVAGAAAEENRKFLGFSLHRHALGDHTAIARRSKTINRDVPPFAEAKRESAYARALTPVAPRSHVAQRSRPAPPTQIAERGSVSKKAHVVRSREVGRAGETRLAVD